MHKPSYSLISWAGIFCLLVLLVAIRPRDPRVHGRSFRVLALYENGGHHIDFSRAARTWLDQLARDSGFSIDYIQKPDSLDDQMLDKYNLFIQLDYPPYGWGKKAEHAFIHFIEQGRGGWIGLHHASLLGEFDGYTVWPWYQEFMGGIRFTNYIPGFASASVLVEDSLHPVMAGIPREFPIAKEEWYTYDSNPRSSLHILARVDENSYHPDSKIKMGDHPVIWTNLRVKARNIYIFMGHGPDLLANPVYRKILSQAIFWAAATP